MKKAVFQLIVGGTNISARVNPYLISLSVVNSVGTHSDTASVELDDTDAQLILPMDGDPMMVLLGWEDGGVRMVFEGTVDEIQSSGSRGGGRTVSVSAKGVDTKGKAKQPQQRHFDDKTVKDVLTDTGKTAGITQVDVDPDLAEIKRPYVGLHDESFIHLGERLAREVGGNFHITGNRATMSKRDSSYTAFVTATWGDNLHEWSISPKLGRPQFNKTRSRWYDRVKATQEEETNDTSLDADSLWTSRYGEPNKEQAEKRTKSDSATSERDKGEGTITIEGNTEAIPDGLCIVVGARPGVDGSYRIESATHTYDRGGGFTTSLSLKQPGGGAGTDSRGTSTGTSGAGSTPSAGTPASSGGGLDPLWNTRS